MVLLAKEGLVSVIFTTFQFPGQFGVCVGGGAVFYNMIRFGDLSVWGERGRGYNQRGTEGEARHAVAMRLGNLSL